MLYFFVLTFLDRGFWRQRLRTGSFFHQFHKLKVQRMRYRNSLFPFLFLSLSLFAPPAVISQLANHVVISEVAPMGGSSSVYNSGEFIELYNPTGSDIIFGANVTIVSGNTSGTNTAEWTLSLSGKTIPAFGFLLVGDGGVAGRDASFPSSKNLANSGIRSCVQLRDGVIVIDAFGWDPVLAPTLANEGARFAPSSTSSTKKSFERKSSSSSIGPDLFGNGYDTNENSTDFFENDSTHDNPQSSVSPTESPFTGPDTVGPVILTLQVLSATSVQLQFNEALDSLSSSTAANYALTGGASVISAQRQQANQSRVVLTTTVMANGVYSIDVSAVKDTAGNIMAAKNRQYSYGVISIATARSLGEGNTVRVRGRVTVGAEFASPAYIQDSTAGIAVFNTTFSTRAKPGDDWEVAGSLKSFNGLLEIDPLTDSLLISTGNAPPAPLLITSEGLTEADEARLVRINKAKINALGSFGPNTADSTYVAGDASGVFEMRVDRNTNIPNAPIPTDSVNIVGIVNDFLGTYRLMPRSYADIGVNDPVPGQDWTDIAVARNYSAGTPVRVRGIVTFNQTNATTNTIFIQDATGGIALFSTATNALQIGDSVQVYGAMGSFNNLAEIVNIDTLWTFGSGHPLPEPRVLGVTQASEAFEGMLVKFHAVRFMESGSFAGNTTYHLTNGTSSLDVRIPNLSPVIGTVIPAGAIDAVGVLGQFQSTYQLTPRSTGDLIGLPGPQISGTPVVDTLFDDGFRIRWNTVTAGTTKLLFGPGENFTDSLETTAEVTEHSMTVTGLRPGRIYAYQSVSSNSSGVSDAGKGYAVTTSSGSSGQISVYFNYSVDTTMGLAERAQGNVDLGGKILERIAAATKSIDMALYSFGDFNASAPDIVGRVADSLIAAKNRGVKVRMVFHDRTTTPEVNALMSAGIPVLKRTVVSTGSGMHNKFWVFDGRDTLNAADDWVVTGSWNMTDEGTYRDGQNAVFVQDQSLAAMYTKEFEEMFGSFTDTPNAGAARFGPTKRNDTPHWTMVGGTKVEVYFSPSDRTSANITRSAATANYNLFFGLLTFTRDEIAAELIARKNAGVIVRGIVDNTNDSGSDFSILQGAGIDVLSAGHGVVLGQFHHKYGIVDPFHDESDPMVITGSHNWSSSADGDNDENTVIIHSGSLARQFVEEFSKRYAESGGAGAVLGVERLKESIPSSYTLSSPYPNPFNPATSVEFSVPVASHVRVIVYDVLGREVATLADGRFEPGTFRAVWDASRSASGMYVVVMQAGDQRIMSKAVLVK